MKGEEIKVESKMATKPVNMPSSASHRANRDFSGGGATTNEEQLAQERTNPAPSLLTHPSICTETVNASIVEQSS